jgi:hypothetical protein
MTVCCVPERKENTPFVLEGMLQPAAASLQGQDRKVTLCQIPFDFRFHDEKVEAHSGIFEESDVICVPSNGISLSCVQPHSGTTVSTLSVPSVYLISLRDRAPLPNSKSLQSQQGGPSRQDEDLRRARLSCRRHDETEEDINRLAVTI